MKKLLLTIMLGTALLANGMNVVVRHNGTATSYVAAEISSVRFSPECVTVLTVSGTEITIPGAEFSSIEFTDGISGVTEAMDRDVKFTFEGTTLCAGSSDIDLYNAKGQLVASGKQGRLDISAIPAGLYVLKTNGLTEKIILK